MVWFSALLIIGIILVPSLPFVFTGNLKFDMIAEGPPLGKNSSLELQYAFNVSICIFPFGLLGVGLWS